MPLPTKKPEAPAYKPANAAEEALLRIINLIDELVLLMNDEIPIVEQRRRNEHAELLKRKQRMTLDYRASLKTFVMQPELMRQVSPELAKRAKDAAARLSEATENNARSLRAIMTASQKLVQSIVSLVKKEVMPAMTYSKSQEGSYSPICKPVTVFQSA